MTGTILERELLRFNHQVNRLGARESHRREVVLLQDLQHLQRRNALTVRDPFALVPSLGNSRPPRNFLTASVR